MTEIQLFNNLQALDIPVAYDHFMTPQKLPFIVYRVNDIDPFNADNITLWYQNNYQVALCTEVRDLNMEASIETMLNNNQLPFTKIIDYIESERFYQTNYYF